MRRPADLTVLEALTRYFDETGDPRFREAMEALKEHISRKARPVGRPPADPRIGEEAMIAYLLDAAGRPAVETDKTIAEKFGVTPKTVEDKRQKLAKALKSQRD